MKYKHIVRDVSRHGTERFYLRIPGQSKKRLEGKPGSPEFDKSYSEALATIATAPVKPEPSAAPKVKPPASGTMDQLIKSWLNTHEFNNFAPRTQTLYRWVCNKIHETYGSELASNLDALRARAMFATMSPAIERNCLKVFHALFKHGTHLGLIEKNPLEGYRPQRPLNSKPHLRWEEEHMAKFEARWPIGTKQRLAYAILRWTGLRVSDAVRLGPQHIKDGVLSIVMQKTERKTNRKAILPVLSELAEVIAATPCEHLTFLVTRNGAPYGAEYFSDIFTDWVKAAGLPKHYTAHGLRHAMGNTLAERGVSPYGIAAVLGHASVRTTSIYTSQANQARLAEEAFAALIKKTN